MTAPLFTATPLPADDPSLGTLDLDELRASDGARQRRRGAISAETMTGADRRAQARASRGSS